MVVVVVVNEARLYGFKIRDESKHHDSTKALKHAITVLEVMPLLPLWGAFFPFIVANRESKHEAEASSLALESLE